MNQRLLDEYDIIDFSPLFTDEAKVAPMLRNLICNTLKVTKRGEVRVFAVFDNQPGYTAWKSRTPALPSHPKTTIWFFRRSPKVANVLQFRISGTGPRLPLSRRLAKLLGSSRTLRSTLGPGFCSGCVRGIRRGLVPRRFPLLLSCPNPIRCAAFC